jgi:hypothetical protein
MQQGYIYDRIHPPGRNFAPEFRPELSPAQMLTLGVFGGKYMTDCRKEFPASWFRRAKLSPSHRDRRLNFFKVNASLPLEAWRQKGWIHPQDPRGWFQIRRNCEPGDRDCRRRQRQAVLHWAYDSRKF